MTDITAGVHVRTKLDTAPYPAGVEFTVKAVRDNGGGLFAIGDPKGCGVWLSDLELVPAEDEYPGENGEYHYAERSGYQEFEDGTLTPKGLKKRNAHIAAIEGQNQVIRDRNETIARLQAQLSEYAHALEKRPAGSNEIYDPNAVTPSEQYVLRALQKRIGEANATKGFHNAPDARSGLMKMKSALRDYQVARLALITTEVAEAIEELRHGHAVDETYYPSAPYTDEQGWVVNAYSEPPFKPEGIPSELADVVIRAFDFAHEFGIDLAAMIDEKLRFNATRQYKHGKEF